MIVHLFSITTTKVEEFSFSIFCFTQIEKTRITREPQDTLVNDQEPASFRCLALTDDKEIDKLT